MAVRLGKFAVYEGRKRRMDKSEAFRTGCSVPDSGIYRVTHAEHRLPSEVTLIAGQNFPRCSKCAEPVHFELVRSAPHADDSHRGFKFKVMLYELPEIQEAEDESLAG